MTVKALNSYVCRIDYNYASDYTPFGEKRFSWYALRDLNREFDINHIYLIKTESEEEEVAFVTAGSVCLICSDGDYTVETFNPETEAVDYKGYISSTNKHSLGLNGGHNVSIVSTMIGGSILLLSEKTILEFEVEENTIELLGEDVYLVNHGGNDKVFEVYDKALFKEYKLDSLSFVCDEGFALKNTFRGLYLHSGEKEQAQLLTCAKGSVEVYLTDTRQNSKTYLDSYCVTLNGSKSLYVGKGIAVGVLALSDDTILNRVSGTPFDSKYIRRVNISSCEKAEKLNTDELIMTVLDRRSEGVETLYV